MHYKIAPLILTPAGKANHTSDVYVSQPDSQKEELAGRIFLLAEIESRRPEDIKIINYIIENLYQNFYQSEKILLREKLDSIKIEHIFEASIAKTNKGLLEFLHLENIKFNPSLFNALVGVIHENEIHFSSVGRNKALLIYKNKKANSQTEGKKGEPKYKIADIIERAKGKDSASKKVNLAKLFSTVVSGKIPKESYFLFTNEAIPEYLTQKQLIDIITNIPPASAMEQIKNLLSQINNYVPFLALLIKNTTGSKEESAASFEAPAEKKDSIRNLKKIEKITEDTLLGGGYLDIKKTISFVQAGFQKLLEASAKLIEIFKKAKVGQMPLGLKDKIFFRKRGFSFIFKKIYLTARDVFALALGFVQSTFKNKWLKLGKKQKEAQDFGGEIRQFSRPDLAEKKAKGFDALAPFKWLVELSFKNKMLILIVLAAIGLLFVNSYRIDKKNKEARIAEASNELAKTIEQKQNQVEANLLYGNETNAKRILDEIKVLLDENSQASAGQARQFNLLKSKHERQINKIKHVADIGAIPEAADFAAINPQANPINITLAGNKIYASDRSQKKIYNLNLDNSQLGSALDFSDIDAIKYPVLDDNGNIYYLDDEKSVIKLDTKNNQISDLKINLAGGINDIGGGAGYGKRLYYINKADNQIYRYAGGPGGFPTAYKWLKDNIDLKNAADIEIDGSIYVLRGSGEVLRFFKGRQEEFSLGKIEPPLEFATKLFISPELDYIYILDVIEKRLIVYNKKGEFILQYTSDQFNKLKDFAADEEKKIIYFLNGTKILKVQAKHFEQ